MIIWFRNDLRLTDHPALTAACAAADEVYPLFILDQNLIHGPRASANRNRFLKTCLIELAARLGERNSGLIIKTGRPEDVILELMRRTGAGAVLATADVSPYARARDKKVTAMQWFPGRLAIGQAGNLVSGSGRPYQVFTPFCKSWLGLERRPVLPEPTIPPLSPDWRRAAVASLAQLDILDRQLVHSPLAAQTLNGGRRAAETRLETFVRDGIGSYHERHDDLAAAATSKLSADLHFGSLSAGEVEHAIQEAEMDVKRHEGATAFRRQLAWRDFYHYILGHFPDNAKREFQERYRRLAWEDDQKLRDAWETGHTGYPIVDAAMRQLLTEGYMHNRARLIVGSFLTKDLELDWRIGETHFMRHLVDGDTANNNGNWQWIASVGVDPAPMFRRLYNPMTQQERYDPTGAYVRRYVPELARVPLEYLARPWEMPEEMQQEVRCIIGRDYPAPVVDHALARQAALERYRLS